MSSLGVRRQWRLSARGVKYEIYTGLYVLINSYVLGSEFDEELKSELSFAISSTHNELGRSADCT
jgi:hypothetical protein